MDLKIGIYQHYKGKSYQTIGVAKHSETLEEMVVYRALYDNFNLWVRPKKMFLEQIILNDIAVDRFKFIRETKEIEGLDLIR